MRPTIRDMLPRKGVAAVGVIAAVIMIAGVTAAVATGSSGSHDDDPAVGDRYPSSYNYIEGTDRNGITATSVAQRASGGRYLPQQACSTDWDDGRHCLDSIVFAGLARDSAIWDNANDIAAVDLWQIDLNRRNIANNQTFTQFTGSLIDTAKKRIDAQQLTIDSANERIDAQQLTIDALKSQLREQTLRACMNQAAITEIQAGYQTPTREIRGLQDICTAAYLAAG